MLYLNRYWRKNIYFSVPWVINWHLLTVSTTLAYGKFCFSRNALLFTHCSDCVFHSLFWEPVLCRLVIWACQGVVTRYKGTVRLYLKRQHMIWVERKWIQQWKMRTRECQICLVWWCLYVFAFSWQISHFSWKCPIWSKT